MARQDRFFSLSPDIAQVEFNKTIAGCYRDGNAEYDAVGVLLLTWKDDDMRCKEMEVDDLEQVFREKFKFNTEHYEIPSTDSSESLFTRLEAFSRCYDSPSKLGIIYYGGHADRKQTEEGVDLELFARRSLHPDGGNFTRTGSNLSDLSIPESPTGIRRNSIIPVMVARPEQPHISFKAICERIRTSETDILMIVDSCYAAGAFTDQSFGSRKCELLCCISEMHWARAAGQEGSFTKALTNALDKLLQENSNGFSTTKLYRELYRRQPEALKPLHFTQSRFDYGRIWLRPCLSDTRTETVPDDTKYTIDVRFHLTKSVDLKELNKFVKALQWIPFVQKIKMQNMRSPDGDLRTLIRTVQLVNRLRPLVARIRRTLESRRARQLFRRDSSSQSPSDRTKAQLHVILDKPRDVGLFDWSGVTLRTEQSNSRWDLVEKEISHGGIAGVRSAIGTAEERGMANAAVGGLNGEHEADALTERGQPLSQLAATVRLPSRAFDCLLFFSMGLLAPTVLSWALQGNA